MWRDENSPATPLERISTFVMVVLVILTAAFIVRVLIAAHEVRADCIPETANCDTGVCCEGLSCQNHRCKPIGPTTTLDPNAPPTTTTTLPPEAGVPIAVTAQDVSVKLRGGFDYGTFRGHEANQYERDMMEQTLLGVWMPRVITYMGSLKACANYAKAAMSASTMNAITPRLDVVHQYDDILGPPDKQWIVTIGGRHYQVEGYILKHAHDCSLNDAEGCAASPLMTTDLADLLDLTVYEGACRDGAGFAPATMEAMGDDPKAGVADGRQHFPPLSGVSAALLDAAVAAHMGGTCGGTPAGSVQAAQTAFEADCGPDLACIHFRTPQPFIGGCAPDMTEAECCGWKQLEHREYIAWADSVRQGDWGLARCNGGRHRRMHLCAWLTHRGLMIRMPPCTRPASYPDDTAAVTCTAYLAAETASPPIPMMEEP